MLRLGKRKTRNSLVFRLDLPPSTNALYIKRGRRQGGGLALSKEATIYREVVRRTIHERLMDVHETIGNGGGEGPEIYGIKIDSYWHHLENPRFFLKKKSGKNKGERLVKLRYKVVDADNRIKFLQDWVCKCLGMIGDQLIFDTQITKKQIPQEEEQHCIVRIFTLDRELYLPPDPEAP